MARPGGSCGCLEVTGGAPSGQRGREGDERLSEVSRQSLPVALWVAGAMGAEGGARGWCSAEGGLVCPPSVTGSSFLPLPGRQTDGSGHSTLLEPAHLRPSGVREQGGPGVRWKVVFPSSWPSQPQPLTPTQTHTLPTGPWPSCLWPFKAQAGSPSPFRAIKWTGKMAEGLGGLLSLAGGRPCPLAQMPQSEQGDKQAEVPGALRAPSPDMTLLSRETPSWGQGQAGIGTRSGRGNPLGPTLATQACGLGGHLCARLGGVTLGQLPTLSGPPSRIRSTGGQEAAGHPRVRE